MPTWIRQARARSLQLPGRVLRLRAVPGSLICSPPLVNGGYFAEHRHELRLMLEVLEGSCPFAFSPRHVLGHLVLPSEVDPRVQPWQEQLHSHVIDAGDLQG